MNCFDLLVIEVQNEYRRLRTDGECRNGTISRILAAYAQELEDSDDRLGVLCGLVYALSKKKELFDDFSIKIFPDFLDTEATAPALEHMRKCTELLADRKLYGEEAMFKRKTSYDPGWKIGDTFAHEICCPESVKWKLKNQFILLTVGGSYQDTRGNKCYLFYASIVPELNKITEHGQFPAVDFVRAMPHSDGWDYFFQLRVRSRKHEQALGLTYIGSFPDFPRPSDQAPENPQTAMPLFDRPNKDAVYPGYEPHICMLYDRYRL